MALGLSSTLSKTGFTNPVAGIVTDSLVLKHNYAAGGVSPVSDGACLFTGAGTEDRMTITETVFNVDGAAYTFAFWAKRNATGVDTCVLGHTSTKNSKYIRFSSSNTLLVEDDGGSNTATITPHTTDTGWHLYAITITGSGATIVAYQDGVLCTDSGDVSGDNLTINMIGAQGTGGAENEFNGYLCNIGIWEEVLTQPQVKSIMWKSYSDLTSTETDNLIHWWALDEGTGTTATDSKGGNTATFTTS